MVVCKHDLSHDPSHRLGNSSTNQSLSKCWHKFNKQIHQSIFLLIACEWTKFVMAHGDFSINIITAKAKEDYGKETEEKQATSLRRRGQVL